MNSLRAYSMNRIGGALHSPRIRAAAFIVSVFAAVLSCLSLVPDAPADFRFHRDGVLGTSFDLAIATIGVRGDAGDVCPRGER